MFQWLHINFREERHIYISKFVNIMPEILILLEWKFSTFPESCCSFGTASTVEEETELFCLCPTKKGTLFESFVPICISVFYHFQWDPMITTPPGLYIMSVALIQPVSQLLQVEREDICTTKILRMTNVFFAVVNFFVLDALLRRIHQNSKVGFSD